MSSHGVTMFRNGEADFTSLDQWQREHKVFRGIDAHPFFQKFRTWKTFHLWFLVALRLSPGS